MVTTVMRIRVTRPNMEKMYFQVDDHLSMAISWRLQFNVERPTFSVPRTYNHWDECALLLREHNVVHVPNVMFEDGVQADREIGDEDMSF